MIKFLISVCLIAAALGASIPENGHTIEEYIVGGKETDIAEVPYQVAMYTEGRFLCGGSIINPTHIVTAAHCVMGQSASSIIFRVGSSKVNSGGAIVQAKSFVYHPKYNRFTIDYDVAVVELEKPLQYNNTVKPIQLATSEPEEGSQVKVSGWGLLKENGQKPTILQSVVVPVVGRKTCAENYKKYSNIITSRMVCAGVEGKDSCQGDSGGPLNKDGLLVGIVSFGKGCARRDLPGVYTNVADPEIASFIKQHAKM